MKVVIFTEYGGADVLHLEEGEYRILSERRGSVVG